MTSYVASILCSLLTAASLSAQSQPASAAMDAANRLFQAQQWSESARAYEAIIKAEPENPRAHYRLGASLYALQRYEESLPAYQRAVDLGHNAQPMYELARAYARLNRKDKAFEWIEKALNAHLQQPRQIGSDPELANLHDDSRFAALAEKGVKAAMVCMNSQGYRQFDFWVGEWRVVNTSNQQVGTNSIRLLEDGCIVEENWTSARGGQTGKSFNFYNPTTGKWHQSYMDNQGGNWMMDGEYKDGALKYEGTIYSPGRTVLVHMTFFNLGPDKVRQWAETSTDQGKSWQVTWDATYLRQK